MDNISVNNNIYNAKQASIKLSKLSDQERCNILKNIQKALYYGQDQILAANAQDMASSIDIQPALKDRLMLNADRLTNIINNIDKVISLENPLKVISEYQHPNNMLIRKVAIPLGLLLVVYEARPNVGIDTVALSLKTANAVFLKGSRQTKYTNQAIADIVKKILQQYDLGDLIQFYTNLTHQEAAILIAHADIDLIIPRGGEKLKSVVKSLAKAPVLGAGGGVCHAYISSAAEPSMAANLIHNAKTQRPSVCNALETVLIHESWLNNNTLLEILEPLKDEQVIFYVDSDMQRYLDGHIGYNSHLVSDNNWWHTEYLDLKISLKVIPSLKEAINHINHYSTGHSDMIISEDLEEIETFLQEIDSACVYANASLRFTDGEEFGFGTEIGISTQKLHARGPIGLTELTSYKYQIIGSGQIT